MTVCVRRELQGGGGRGGVRNTIKQYRGKNIRLLCRREAESLGLCKTAGIVAHVEEIRLVLMHYQSCVRPERDREQQGSLLTQQNTSKASSSAEIITVILHKNVSASS